ncbi:MAG: 1-acyl-sn-glycerol-3-phosphate acyltransferase [Solirubrobacterales bacterium]|jgi:1-acyl-sn-glycerol-3-phosphate acyltransferase|nr:1-acyl-sn-glycerol-3-phosphate acyltransferase [Solirubrobacterales bacterium]
MAACAPYAAWWGRMQVDGLELLPRSGPVLLAGNHDSQMDPVAIGVAARGHRQVRALAKSTLWDSRALAPILTGMGQIPIERGKGDRGALGRAIEALGDGACIGIFPEGTRSLGRELRARSGIGHLAAAVPEAKIVLVAAAGTTDYARFPKRPRVRIRFSLPAEGDHRPGEDPTAFSARLLAQIRAEVPVVASGR